MYKFIVTLVAASLLLGGCASSGGTLVEAGNTPTSCEHQLAMGEVPVARQHDFVRHCSAGYEASHAHDDSTFTLPPPKKDQDGQ